MPPIKAIAARIIEKRFRVFGITFSIVFLFLLNDFRPIIKQCLESYALITTLISLLSRNHNPLSIYSTQSISAITSATSIIALLNYLIPHISREHLSSTNNAPITRSISRRPPEPAAAPTQISSAL
jgi:hypothetical protein